MCPVGDMEKMIDLSFWNGKKVFITGHSGFKGMWLCKILSLLNVQLYGYSLKPSYSPNLNEILAENLSVKETFNDVKNIKALNLAIEQSQAEIVFHLAAQPLVIDGYSNPVDTYEINVMGTVNVLEVVRNIKSVKSLVNITTDKVYRNNEWCWGYRETDALDGYDPYSNSKSCSELVTATYRRCFLQNIAVSTCRAGNVIGGGDFSENRIIPDCVKALAKNEPIVIRNPNSVRPYQHVIEPLLAYILVAQKQYENKDLQGEYNISSSNNDCITTSELVALFCKCWGENDKYVCHENANAPHEANVLRLDSSKISGILGWKSKWDIETAINATVEWYKAYYMNKDVSHLMEQQILSYMNFNGV